MIHFSTIKDRDQWRLHSAHWGGCILCPIGLACTSHVLGRGDLPCEILFCGEAPGPSEDVQGQPFVGRVGRTFDKLLRGVRRKTGPFRYFITNTLACYPDDPSGSYRPPSQTESHKCLPRFMEVVRMARPKGIVFLGKVAEAIGNQITKTDKFPSWPDCRLAVYHPTYLNRKGGASSLEGKKTIQSLIKFISPLVPEDAPF